MVRLALVAALLAVSAPAFAYERARPMGMYAANHGPALAQVDSRIDITVRGPILETVVVQRFRNTGDRDTEATYIFPLPDDAAVSAMSIQVGARIIHAAIEPRDVALRRYEAAVAAGVAAAVLDQERPDVFTQTVSAIPRNGIVEVTLRYDSLAHYESGMWQLVLPMVVAPRYVPGAPDGSGATGSGRAPDTDRAADASRVTPAVAPGAGGTSEVALHFADEPSELASPTHEIAGTRREAKLVDVHSDHDAIVRWRAPANAAGWVEREGNAGFAAVVVEAPPPAPRPAPIRVVFAIDRGPTTRGDADAVERPLVRALFGALGRTDRARVIGSDAIAWSAPEDAHGALERAWASPPGVFDLTRVLASARPEGAAIVLVSDGLVADDPAAIAAARRLGVPIHAIGIGPAPARATLRQLAVATGGTVRFAVAGDDPAVLARAVLADVAAPPARLTVNWGTLAPSDVEPAALPRLGAGQAALVLARIKRPQAANARVRGQLFAFQALAAGRIVDGATTAHGALARRWARERLGALVAASHDARTVAKHALTYGLVSPYTSLVAIGTDVIAPGGIKHSVAIPVSLPSGMQWHAVKPVIDLDTSREIHPEAVAERGAPSTAPAPPPPPPAPTPTATRDSEDRRPATKSPRPTSPPAEGTRDQKKKAKKPARPPAEPPANEKASDDAERPVRGEEVITVTGSTIERKELNTPAPTSVVDRASLEAAGRASIGDAAESVEEVLVLGSRRTIELSAALGGGLAIDRGGRGLLALDVRLETTRRTRLGAEAALWLIDGSDTQGRVLLTVARDVARRFELGFGAGVHFGSGTGVAGSLRLGVATPLRWLTPVLRYDAALLLTPPSARAEHAITLGVELRY
jgi:Ca-activated chloride channel family protein